MHADKCKTYSGVYRQVTVGAILTSNLVRSNIVPKSKKDFSVID
jgi:hypothetical protein